MIRLLWLLARVGLGLLFVVAGALKLRDPSGFATSISHYQLFPDLATYLAVFLPPTEIVAGTALLLPRVPWQRAGALVAAAMAAMFVVAAGWAVSRGINVDCGCFGSAGGTVDAMTVARNIALLVLTCALVLRRDAPSP